MGWGEGSPGDEFWINGRRDSWGRLKRRELQVSKGEETRLGTRMEALREGGVEMVYVAKGEVGGPGEVSSPLLN